MNYSCPRACWEQWMGLNHKSFLQCIELTKMHPSKAFTMLFGLTYPNGKARCISYVPENLQAYFVRASEQHVNKTLHQSNKHLLFFQHDLCDLRFIFDSVALLVWAWMIRMCVLEAATTRLIYPQRNSGNYKTQRWLVLINNPITLPYIWFFSHPHCNLPISPSLSHLNHAIL